MTTKLEVMNNMLGVVGEQPITNVNSNHPSALAASVQIDKISKEFQARGWWFNKEKNYTLNPENATGFLILPQNTLDVDPCNPSSKLVQRGRKLYDPLNHTFDIGEPVDVNIVVQLDIEDLPEIAATYLKAKCAKDFYVNDEGDETKAKELKNDLVLAWAALQQAELQNSDVNANNRPITALLRSRMNQQGSRSNPNWPGGR
jgi:hypothetical protein